MSKFKDNFSSESFYPDSNYYLDQNNSPKEDPISKDQKSNMGGDFKWPNTYWFIAEITNAVKTKHIEANVSQTHLYHFC